MQLPQVGSRLKLRGRWDIYNGGYRPVALDINQHYLVAAQELRGPNPDDVLIMIQSVHRNNWIAVPRHDLFAFDKVVLSGNAELEADTTRFFYPATEVGRVVRATKELPDPDGGVQLLVRGYYLTVGFNWVTFLDKPTFRLAIFDEVTMKVRHLVAKDYQYLRLLSPKQEVARRKAMAEKYAKCLQDNIDKGTLLW